VLVSLEFNIVILVIVFGTFVFFMFDFWLVLCLIFFI